MVKNNIYAHNDCAVFRQANFFHEKESWSFYYYYLVLRDIKTFFGTHIDFFDKVVSFVSYRNDVLLGFNENNPDFNSFLHSVPFWLFWKHQKIKGFPMFSERSRGNIRKATVKVSNFLLNWSEERAAFLITILYAQHSTGKLHHENLFVSFKKTYQKFQILFGEKEWVGHLDFNVFIFYVFYVFSFLYFTRFTPVIPIYFNVFQQFSGKRWNKLKNWHIID